MIDVKEDAQKARINETSNNNIITKFVGLGIAAAIIVLITKRVGQQETLKTLSQ